MASVKDFIKENLEEEFDIDIDNVDLDEEYNPKKKRALLKKLKTTHKELSSVWGDTDAIRASGLDVGGMKSRAKEYSKAYKDLMKYTSKESIESSGHEANFKKAFEAKKKLDGMAKEIMKYEAKIKGGTAKAAATAGKKAAAKTRATAAEGAAKTKASSAKLKASAIVTKKAAGKAGREATKAKFKSDVKKKVAAIKTTGMAKATVAKDLITQFNKSR